MSVLQKRRGGRSFTAAAMLCAMVLPMANLHCSQDKPPAKLTAGANDSYPWVPDQGDATYRNPILFADYSDPDVIRVGDDFYLTASSFNCTPGLPILHSRDLVNWTIINHALKNVPGEQYNKPLHGCGVWAPAIRYHDGKFWIFFPTPDEGIYVTTAKDPAGEWSEPHLLLAGKGLIDPCPLWDDDGKAYLVHAYANSRAGIKHRLDVRPMAPDASTMLGQGQQVFMDPQRHPTMEGPKFLKKDGWYYILAPAGGVSGGWQVALRSKNVYGPYEDKVVLEKGDSPTNGPHQGGIVELKSGESWFVHFQELQPYGRIVHLEPVEWQDGWPMMGVNRNPVLRYRKPDVGKTYPVQIPQTSDEFDSPKLGLQWQWHANHTDDACSLSARPGWLRLPARFVEGGDFMNTPNLLLQKLPAQSFVVETKLDASGLKPGEMAGLVVMGLKHAAIAVRRRSAQDCELLFLVNNLPTASVLCDHSVAMRLEMREGGVCQFGFKGGSVTQPDFQAVEGRWIGAKVGFFCMTSKEGADSGHADFDYFRFSSLR